MGVEQTKALNPLKKLEAEISAAKNMKDLLRIDAVSNRYIANYEAGTGRRDGREAFERDAFAMMELANNKPDILEADAFSIFAGLAKAGLTGLPISSGKLSIYTQNVKQKDGSYKKVLVVKPDAHGKKEMLERMPEIKKVDEGVVVFNKDNFVYDAKKKLVVKHEQAWPRPVASEDTVAGAYCTIHFADGHVEDVLVTLDELKKARAKSTNVSYVNGQKVNDGGQLWTMHYGEACKKTTYNRAYKIHYKQPSTAVIFKQYEMDDEDQSKTNDVTHTIVDEAELHNNQPVQEAETIADAEVVNDAPKQKKETGKNKPSKEEASFL